MTGHADELAVRRAADGPPILAKPFGRKRLAEAVRSALGARSRG